jgi:2-polyprenyl-6-methoxyphenol hydroxylase-like FAD-dependent oxidoreductase
MHLTLIFSVFLMTVTLGKHVVIVGAGPGGLLSAINFVRRGWKVTLVEKDSDLSSVAVSSKKSWAIGLNRFGEDALNRVPGLLEHVKPAAIKLQKAIMVMFGRKVEDEMENQVVDRNYMVQLLTEYLFQLSSSVGDNFDVMFSTNIIHVDGKKANC